MDPLRPATPEERDTLIPLIPTCAAEPRYAGGIVSVLGCLDGQLIDGGASLDAERALFVRPLPRCDPATLELWWSLLDRRRGQLAHDASGPATGVLAALETVLEYEPIPESTRGLLEEARAGVMRLTRVLNARGALGSAATNVVVGPLAALLSRHCAAALEVLDPCSERMRVHVRAPDDDARIDAGLVDGALSVLLSNAYKCRRGARVEVQFDAELRDGWLRLSVEDDGRGMEGETLRRAGELGFTTRPGGAGLGLFGLRRALAARSGALLIQSSRGQTRGTVLLPLNASATESAHRE